MTTLGSIFRLIVVVFVASCSTESVLDSPNTQRSAGALVASLTEQLGVNTDQAVGGAGALFSYAEEQLPGREFARIADAVPGIDGLIEQAAILTGSSGPMVDRDDLTWQFAQLGMDPGMVESFANAVSEFLTKSAGADVGHLLLNIV